MTDATVPAHPAVTILYVEDEEAIRTQLSRFLTSNGYQVFCAENGEQGLEFFRTHTPDIVLTDIIMPKLNGLEMARAIRALSTQVQIVCITALSDPASLIEAIDVGINQFVLKPVQLKRLLAALGRCHETIELRRHREAQEQELARARKIDAIGILAGGMAHDFNNLLQVILGYVSLARMNTEPDTRIHTMLEAAEKSSATAKELSDRLLTLARGGDTFMKQAQLAPIIREAVADTLDAASDGIEISFDLPDSLPRFLIDPGHMHQLFTKLAANARDAMPDGGALRVTGDVRSIADNNAFSLPSGAYLHITVSDSGCGIAPEHLPQIFDPYFTTKEMGAQKGRGLSLALCHAIVKRHLGHIHAESSPGTGTDIHIYLPVRQAP